MKKIGFFAAWLTAGATIETALDNGGAMMVFAISMIVLVACAAALTIRDD